MTNFYGFDWQNMPSYSRLFSQPVVNRAQSAFTQGMGQFKQFDPAQLEQLKAQRAAMAAQQAKPTTQSKMYVGPDGRVYSMGEGVSGINSFIQSYGRNNPNLLRNPYEMVEGGNILSSGKLYDALSGGKKYTLDQLGFKPLSGV